MLSYEKFKEEVRKNFIGYMPKKYQGISVLIKPIEKVNRVCDALYLNEGCVKPIVHLDEMYEQYTSGESFDGVLEDAAKKMIIGYEQIPIVDVKRVLVIKKGDNQYEDNLYSNTETPWRRIQILSSHS